MPATVLIVEDEPALTFILRSALKKEGYKVLAATRAEAGLALARRRPPDAVILDIGLPGLDGHEFLRRWRAESGSPVLILSAKAGEVDRILGLKLGADDFVAKPFSVEEVMLRVRGMLKGAASRAGASVPLRAAYGELSVDWERHEVRVRSVPVRLGSRELRVLRLLVEARGKVLSRERLARGLWDGDAEPDIRSVDQLVARLRRKLGSARTLVVTLSGLGYAFKAPAGGRGAPSAGAPRKPLTPRRRTAARS